MRPWYSKIGIGNVIITVIRVDAASGVLFATVSYCITCPCFLIETCFNNILDSYKIKDLNICKALILHLVLAVVLI